MTASQVAMEIDFNDVDLARLGLWRSEHWHVRLHFNQCYIGRSLLIANRECDDSLATCSPAEFVDLRMCLRSFEDVINRVFGPDRFNYTQLGNEWQQLHVHAIPRYSRPVRWRHHSVLDPRFGMNPTPKGSPPMPLDDVYELATELREEFGRSGGK